MLPSGEVLLFGGWDSPNGHMTDTWTFDGTAWSNVTPQDAPWGVREFGLGPRAARAGGGRSW
jgi:hypothetical protein